MFDIASICSTMAAESLTPGYVGQTRARSGTGFARNGSTSPCVRDDRGRPGRAGGVWGRRTRSCGWRPSAHGEVSNRRAGLTVQCLTAKSALSSM